MTFKRNHLLTGKKLFSKCNLFVNRVWESDTGYFILQFLTIQLNYAVLTGVIKSIDTLLKVIDPM